MSRRTTRGSKSPIALTAVALLALILGACYILSDLDPSALLADLERILYDELTPTAAVGSGGDWWQVYFTEPQDRYDLENLAGTVPGELIGRIQAAQNTIHIAAFEFNLTAVAEALVAAHRRGVEVRWVTDDEYGLEVDGEEGHGQFAMLERAGIQVKDDGRSALMHDKFWIFDGQTVWTGSMNATVNDSFRNNNNVLVIESPPLAALYEREFAEMWDGQFGPTSPSTTGDQTVTVDGTPVSVLFAPEDQAMNQLIALIKGSQSSIRFMAFSFTHDELGAAILARAQAGVDVRGIFETRGSETEYSELSPLYCAGVSVRQDGNPGSFHHKVLIVDGETVVTGSLNFSQNADESNDENVVIVRNADIAAQYLDEFERRWVEATAPKSTDVRCN
jgi:phosphatidylserine/phosphatidylglycerophosphate/cardiolipin synthase-like enzyme